MPITGGLLTSIRIFVSYGPGLALVFLINAGIWLQRADIVDREHRVRNIATEYLYEYYDFVIIGGGSAGATIASRLTENDKWNVLLLEAGPDETFLSELPMLFPALQQTNLDWKFKTEYSGEYCLALEGGQCSWPRGRVLGGSSVLNAMLYVRGNRRDYDKWRDMGNEGWGWDDVLPYFKKLEDMRDETVQNKLHGVGGPLSVEHFRTVSPLMKLFLKAADEMGHYNPEHEVNGAVQTGFARSHGTIRDGLRCSTAKAYIRPASKRPNLHVALYSHVTKILIDPESKQAYGVEFLRDEHIQQVYATKEVILSAGALQSPQILKLSGIGPKEELIYHEIEVIKDAPGVGENLQDHVAMGGGNYLIENPFNPEDTLSFIAPKMMNVDAAREFIFGASGTLYGMPAAEVMGFINTKYQDPKLDWPDIQIFLGAYSENSDGGIYGKKATDMTNNYYSSVYEPIIFRDTYMFMPLLMRPKSRGKILLRDKDPLSYPLIYANYFQHPDDIRILVKAHIYIY